MITEMPEADFSSEEASDHFFGTAAQSAPACEMNTSTRLDSVSFVFDRGSENAFANFSAR